MISWLFLVIMSWCRCIDKDLKALHRYSNLWIPNGSSLCCCSNTYTYTLYPFDIDHFILSFICLLQEKYVCCCRLDRTQFMGITLKALKLTKRGSFVARGGPEPSVPTGYWCPRLLRIHSAMIQLTMIQSLRGHLSQLCNLEWSNLS